MDFHLCKSRRGSNPDTVVNCNSSSGSGGINANPGTTSGSCQACSRPISIHICPTTGGVFQLDIASSETIQGLRKLISRKLSVSHDRISLLHKDKLLKDGSLCDHQIIDGSRLTLLPNVESGIMSSQPEVSVMQALENLSEGQVNDFLNGKSPLTLAMRLGNHMMFLQLQLSNASAGAKRGHNGVSPTRGKASRQPTLARTVPSASQEAPITLGVPPRTVPGASQEAPITLGVPARTVPGASQEAPITLGVPARTVPGASQEAPITLDVPARTIPIFRQEAPATLTVPPTKTVPRASNTIFQDKLSLPATLIPPLVMTPPPSPKSPSGATPATYTYPVTTLHAPSTTVTSSNDITLDPGNTPPPSPCYVQKTIPNLPTIQINDQTSACEAAGEGTIMDTGCGSSANVRTCPQTPPVGKKDSTCSTKPGMTFLDNSTLAEAKKSLSMKLKEFSKQANTEKRDEVPRPGAVIESMQKLGRGVYSGTFSGTLNPGLQDPEGRPRKSVSTIVHILNDLLGASPSRTGPPARTRGLFQPNSEHTQTTEASRQEQEKESIRGKVEHLQEMMEDRRRRRHARRHTRAAPYPAQRHDEPTRGDEPSSMEVDAPSSDTSSDYVYDARDDDTTHVTT